MKPEWGSSRLSSTVQSKSDASGWNKHVNKFQKRIGNKVVRRLLRRDTEELDRKYR
jgi:hypothetical protein